MKDVSELTGVNYSTIRKIISKFRRGEYKLNISPIKTGRKNILK